jgi:excisionase family DNA binding protein
MKLLTAKQAAQILGVDDSRVRVLIREGRLPAQKIGRDWIILEPDLEFVKDRKPGRPKKQKGDHGPRENN